MSQEHLEEPTELHDVKIEEVMRLQNRQLQLLRELGIAQMIEKETGLEIPPLVFEDDHTQPPKTDWMRTLQMGLPDGRHLSFSGEWMLISVPTLTDKDVFDRTLRITAFRFTTQRVIEIFRLTCAHDTQFVLIEFSQDKHLKVAGDKTTFEGDLTAVNRELLIRVQTGIQAAFTNPQTKKGVEFSLMFGNPPRQISRS